MRIRKVLPGDRAKILELLKQVRLFTEEEISCALELLEIYLTNPNQKDYDFFCCADDADALAGYVCYGKVPLTDAVYDLYWIAVDSTSQNRGVGKTLLAHLDGLLLAKGARMLLAETSSKVSYGKTRSFYGKNGFVEVSRIPDFYAENDAKIVFGKFYSLYERRNKDRWSVPEASLTGSGETRPTSNGTIGAGRSAIASEA